MPSSNLVQAPFTSIEVDGETYAVKNRAVWLKDTRGKNVPVMWNVGSSEEDFREKIRKKLQVLGGTAGEWRAHAVSELH